jgi:hypothetical protein
LTAAACPCFPAHDPHAPPTACRPPQEHAALVLDACEQQRADRAAKAARARARTAERAWLQLLRTLWRRVQMDRRMDDDPAEAHALMAAPRAASGELDRGGSGGVGVGVGGGGRKRTAKEALQALADEGGALPGGGRNALGALQQAGKRAQRGAAPAGTQQDEGTAPEADPQQPPQPQAPLMEGLEVEEF